MRSTFRNTIILPVVLLMLLFSSCMPGYRFAQRFVKEKEIKPALMIVPHNYTFLYYYPFDPVQPETQFDNSADISESDFLNDINTEKADSIFLSALFNHLNEYPLQVFRPEQFDEFLAYPGNRYIFTIAQTEIIEYDQPETYRAMIDTAVYRQDFLLRQVARNTWFEFVKVDDSTDDTGMQVLYSTFFASDEVDGGFRYRPFTGEVFYEYTSRLLELRDIDLLNRRAGYNNAQYIYEHLLNLYVQQNVRPSAAEHYFYRYNPYTGNIIRDRNDQRFIIIEDQ